MEYTDEYSFARPYLTAGEAVLWKGKPGTGHLFTYQDVYLIPFSIFWCGFAVFWEASVLASGAPFFFSIWGIPFVCVGLYMVFGRFLWTAFIRRRTAYVITTKKIIRARGNKIDMLDGRTMPPIHVTAYRDGSGTIRFGQTYYHYRRSYNSFSPNAGVFTLENIPDVAKVQQLIGTMER